jgi:putative hydrolase of the HAD superfamily
MVLVFDLDDTLYDERTFVESGFRAVARLGAEQFGWDAGESFATMIAVLDREGRGAVFDRWLEQHGALSAELVTECVRVYRHHTPELELDQTAARMLPELATTHRLYVVTDGHEVVQANKIAALGVNELVEEAYITYRYGIARSKPSTYCFELIKERESCSWSEMMYVGDNPAKDFVNLNPLGVHTVRVLTGVHRDVVAAQGYDARHTIPDLAHFEDLLARLLQRGDMQ